MNTSPIFALALIIAVVIPAAANWHFDFEEGLPPELQLKNAAITNDPQFIISGSRSIIADFRTSTGYWNEFLDSTPNLKLEANKLYRISFRYKIVDPGNAETRFYSVFKSRSGGEFYGPFWMWNREKGTTGRIDRLLRTDNDGYTLIMGVRGQGALAVDDITITDVTNMPIDPSVRVNPGRSRIAGPKAEFDRLRYSQQLPDLVRDFAIIVCNEGAGAKAINSARQIVSSLSPDFVDWSPFGPLAKDYGIRSSRGGPEYQEFYKFEGPKIWDQRYEKFINSGFAVSLDGTTIRDETWGEGGYFTCQNGPNWHRWFTEELSAVASTITSICQDNISCAPWVKGYGCFCEACEREFRAYLKGRYTTDEFAKMGIPDLDKFSAREYFVSRGRWGFKAVEDPVVREYIKFQHISQLEAWARVVAAVKEVGRKQGRAIPVYGNQIGAFGMWPFAVAISQFTDIVEIEEVIGIDDDIPFQSMYYKLGLASGEHEKPVWVRGPVYDAKKERTPALQTAFWSVHFAEALANGGFRDFSLGMNAPWTGDPSTLDFMDDPALFSLYGTYAKFIDDNRALFTWRENLSRVALVYSLPSMIFRRYYPLDLDDNSAFERVQKTADLLDESHIPYDALVFGHPEIWDDTKTLSRLSKYEVIVLPAIDAVSDAQAAALKRFVEGGGKVVVADPKAGTRDQDFNPRPTPALVDIPMIDLNDREVALAVMGEASIVQVDAPKTVTANVWRSAEGKSLDIHLLNYDVAVQSNKVNPATGVQVTVTPPKDLVFDKAVLTRPGVRKQFISFERDGDKVRFAVPDLEDYAIISLTAGDALEAATNKLKERRRQDREAVKKLAREKNLY